MPTCTHCRHADYAHIAGECVACGCVHFEAKPKREDRSRAWIVTVGFFEFNRWLPNVEVRVRAHGIGGAAMKAIRQVKHERASKRRILQTRITVVPVGRSAAS